MKRGEANPNWKGGRISKCCEVCGASYSVSRPQAKSRFCSLQCVGISQRGRALPPRARMSKICAVCSVEFSISRAHMHRIKCCSRRCGGRLRAQLQSGEGNANWHGGLSRLPYPWNFRFISRAIIARDGFACSNPGCAGTDPRLTAHHIDYDKTNCDHTNLITLCSACNSKANFDRQKWTEFYSAMMQSGRVQNA